MKKPALLYAVVATVVALGIATYYFLSYPNIYDAIPTSGVAVIQVKDWEQFANKLSTSYTGMEMKKTPFLQKLLNEIEEIQGLLESKEPDAWQFYSGKTLASVHLISADNYDFLYTCTGSVWSEKELLKFIQAQKQVSSVRERVYKGQYVLDVMMADGKLLTIAKVKGILTVSFTSFLVENSIKAILGGANIEDDKAFRSVRKKFVPAGDLSVYFNFKKADVILPVAFKEEKANLLQNLNQFAEWGAYNFTMTNQTLELSGLAYSIEEKANLSEHSDLMKNAILSAVPDNIAILIAGYNQNKHIEDPPFSKQFLPWIGQAHALVILETLEEDFNNQGAIVIQVRDARLAKNNLLQMGAKELLSFIPNDTTLKSGVYNLKNTELLNRYFGHGMIRWEECYFTFHRDAVIFCNNPNTLNFVYEKIDKGETLLNDPRLEGVKSKFVTKADQIFYANTARAEMLLQGLLKNKSSVKDYFLQFGQLMISSSFKEEWISSTGIFQLGSDKKTTPGILWRTALQAASVFQPQIVLNINTQEKEIMTQDTAGNIYLLNKGGEVLFTKNIGEPVISGIYQLDYYNSGKLQYIFNSANHVFVIDRFGNDVASYPLKLTRVATAGLTLVQDPASKIYRYYIPSDNEGVYGYESTGRPLPGWSPSPSVGICNRPLQNIRMNNRSQFVAFTIDGKLLMMDERGRELWKVSNLTVTNQDYSIVSKLNDFVLLNASGKELTEISSDGNDRIKPLVDDANSFVATATSDSTYLYFFSNSNEIRAYDGEGVFKNSAYLKDGNISTIEVVYIAAEKHLLVKDEVASKIYIYSLSLEPEGIVAVDNVATVTIADLLDRNEFIAIATDNKGYIICSRIR